MSGCSFTAQICGSVGVSHCTSSEIKKVGELAHWQALWREVAAWVKNWDSPELEQVATLHSLFL